MTPGQKQIVIRLPEELYRAIHDSAAKNDRPLAREIRRALRWYLQTPTEEEARHGR